MKPWQPMSSAPIDGTWIRARGHDFGDPTQRKHSAIAYYEDGNWHEVGSGGSSLLYLIEWQPFAGITRT